MTKQPTLTDITSLTNSSAITALSQNWDAIQEAFDNTLSLDGSTPNAMNADLDLNGNALLNVGTMDVTNLTLDGQTITDLASVPEWRGAWVTTTAYAKNDLVKTSGNVYICLEAHTSGTFATDFTADKWELMVSKGDSGAGTGDMLAANNLSDIADDTTARANIGLGSVATENTVPVSKGGTGATDSSTARLNLGLGNLAVEDSITTSLFSASTLVTASDTISSNDNDTTIPTSAAVVDHVLASTKQLLDKTEVQSCNGLTYVDFTSVIPAGVDEILVFVAGTSGTTTAQLLVRLMVGGVQVNSGYTNTAGLTSGFSLPFLTASQSGTGVFHLYKNSDGGWMFSSGGSGTAGYMTSNPGIVDGIRLTNSTGNFDAGTAWIAWRKP